MLDQPRGKERKVQKGTVNGAHTQHSKTEVASKVVLLRYVRESTYENQSGQQSRPKAVRQRLRVCTGFAWGTVVSITWLACAVRARTRTCAYAKNERHESVTYCQNGRRMQLGHKRWFARSTKRGAAGSPQAARRDNFYGQCAFSERETYSRSRYRGVPMVERADVVESVVRMYGKNKNKIRDACFAPLFRTSKTRLLELGTLSEFEQTSFERAQQTCEK